MADKGGDVNFMKDKEGSKGESKRPQMGPKWNNVAYDEKLNCTNLNVQCSFLPPKSYQYSKNLYFANFGVGKCPFWSDLA